MNAGAALAVAIESCDQGIHGLSVSYWSAIFAADVDGAVRTYRALVAARIRLEILVRLAEAVAPRPDPVAGDRMSLAAARFEAHLGGQMPGAGT
jgi:hypothetical protein